MKCPACRCEDVVFKFKIREFPYFFCRGCRSLFIEPETLTPEVYKIYDQRYYENNAYEADDDKKGYPSYGDSEKTLKEGFRNKLQVIKKYCSSGTLLDAGAAYGYFLLSAQNDFQCSGLEVSEYAASVAREKYALDVVTGSLEKTAFSDAQFDVVTMWDIVEHIVNPSLALQEVYRILKPGGYLFISTDNAAHWLPRVLGRRWWALGAPYHVFHFSKQALDQVAVSIGFEQPRYHKDPRKYSVSEIIAHFGVSYGSSFLNYLGKLLHKIRVGNITINIARPEQFIAVIRKGDADLKSNMRCPPLKL